MYVVVHNYVSCCGGCFTSGIHQYYIACSSHMSYINNTQKVGKSAAGKCYIEFIEMHGRVWSAESNCQKFARNIVTCLNLEWPEHIPVVEDIVPSVLDLGFLLGE